MASAGRPQNHQASSSHHNQGLNQRSSQTRRGNESILWYQATPHRMNIDTQESWAMCSFESDSNHNLLGEMGLPQKQLTSRAWATKLWGRATLDPTAPDRTFLQQQWLEAVIQGSNNNGIQQFFQSINPAKPINRSSNSEKKCPFLPGGLQRTMQKTYSPMQYRNKNTRASYSSSFLTN